MSKYGCTFCNGGTALVTGEETNDIGIAIHYPNKLVAYGFNVHGFGKNGISVEIKYCPMCGCELKEARFDHKETEYIKHIEKVLGFELYPYQKALIFKKPCNVPKGRQNGYTTAYILRLLLSEGPPIELYDRATRLAICDSNHGPWYADWFINELRGIYKKLSETPLKDSLREIRFSYGAGHTYAKRYRDPSLDTPVTNDINNADFSGWTMGWSKR